MFGFLTACRYSLKGKGNVRRTTRNTIMVDGSRISLYGAVSFRHRGKGKGLPVTLINGTIVRIFLLTAHINCSKVNIDEKVGLLIAQYLHRTITNGRTVGIVLFKSGEHSCFVLDPPPKGPVDSRCVASSPLRLVAPGILTKVHKAVRAHLAEWIREAQTSAGQLAKQLQPAKGARSSPSSSSSSLGLRRSPRSLDKTAQSGSDGSDDEPLSPEKPEKTPRKDPGLDNRKVERLLERLLKKHARNTFVGAEPHDRGRGAKYASTVAERQRWEDKREASQREFLQGAAKERELVRLEREQSRKAMVQMFSETISSLKEIALAQAQRPFDRGGSSPSDCFSMSQLREMQGLFGNK